MNFLFLDTVGRESGFELSGHHLARLLARRGHRVVSLFSPVTPWHRLSREGAETIQRRFAAHRAGLVGDAYGVLSYVPLSWIPVRALFPLDSISMLRLAAKFYQRDVLRRLRSIDFWPDIISLQNMMFFPLARLFPQALLNVRISDRMHAFGDVPHSMLDCARMACAAAQVISVTSLELEQQIAPSLRHKTIHTPNAADQAHFMRALPRPAAYAGIAKPIAVYIGVLREWFDWELLMEIVRHADDFHYVLISPSPAHPEISALENVTYIPGVPYEEIPAYYQHAAVSIIPFRKTQLTDAFNPLKLHESLAAGTPVVAVGWSELRRLQAPVALAGGAEEFAAAMRREAMRPRPIDAREFLASHTWESNVDKLMERIEAVQQEQASADRVN